MYQGSGLVVDAVGMAWAAFRFSANALSLDNTLLKPAHEFPARKKLANCSATCFLIRRKLLEGQESKQHATFLCWS